VAHANRLAGKAAFTEEITAAQNSEGRFLAFFGYNGKLYSSFLNIENIVNRVALSEDCLPFLERNNRSSGSNGGKESGRIEDAVLLNHSGGTHYVPFYADQARQMSFIVTTGRDSLLPVPK
jgi:hypothetical protein